jgi:hypothetical protein
MGNVFGALYCVVGGVAGLLNIWLCLVRSDCWKIFAAKVLITSSVFNALLLLATGIWHILYHLQKKAQIITACIRGTENSLVEDVSLFSSLPKSS